MITIGKCTLFLLILPINTRTVAKRKVWCWARATPFKIHHQVLALPCWWLKMDKRCSELLEIASKCDHYITCHTHKKSSRPACAIFCSVRYNLSLCSHQQTRKLSQLWVLYSLAKLLFGVVQTITATSSISQTTQHHFYVCCAACWFHTKQSIYSSISSATNSWTWRIPRALSHR